MKSRQEAEVFTVLESQCWRVTETSTTKIARLIQTHCFAFPLNQALKKSFESFGAHGVSRFSGFSVPKRARETCDFAGLPLFPGVSVQSFGPAALCFALRLDFQFAPDGDALLARRFPEFFGSAAVVPKWQQFRCHWPKTGLCASREEVDWA